MNPEQLEEVLVQALPTHLSNYWTAKLTDFSDGEERDAIVSFQDTVFTNIVAGEDPRFSRQSVDQADTTLRITFNSAALAPRATFDNTYREVKACVTALSKERQELWTISGIVRSVVKIAESPVRTMEFDINVRQMV